MMTAKEFLEHISENGKYTFDWEEFGVLFAKYHVDQALKAVEDKIIVRGYAGSIMNCYPTENIK